MPRVAILGATGYTALELIQILLRHPQAAITALTSREPRPLAEVHPSLFGRLDVACEDLSPAEVAARADVAFCCLPHGASMDVVPELLSLGLRVLDLSADYRLNDVETYEKWYGLEHVDSARLAGTPYGLPELFPNALRDAQLIAVPGCYCTTAILAIAPLLCEGWIDPSGIIIDAKSGVSGAGRKPKLGTLFPECNESVSAYSVGTHRHTGEIQQVLSTACGNPVGVTFTPHLMPMDRGILATIYPRQIKEGSREDLLAAMRSFYAGKPFVRVVDAVPGTKQTAHSNFCDMTCVQAEDQLIVLSALDNLVKGASGAAVQNFNLMHGFPETTALR